MIPQILVHSLKGAHQGVKGISAHGESSLGLLPTQGASPDRSICTSPWLHQDSLHVRLSVKRPCALQQKPLLQSMQAPLPNRILISAQPRAGFLTCAQTLQLTCGGIGSSGVLMAACPQAAQVQLGQCQSPLGASAIPVHCACMTAGHVSQHSRSPCMHVPLHYQDACRHRRTPKEALMNCQTFSALAYSRWRPKLSITPGLSESLGVQC